MGGGVSRPLGNSHGNQAQLHRDLVAHALLRREDLKDMSRRAGTTSNPKYRAFAQEAIREVESEGMYNEDTRTHLRNEQRERIAMYRQDTRTQMRNPERNRQRGRGGGRRGRREIY